MKFSSQTTSKISSPMGNLLWSCILEVTIEEGCKPIQVTLSPFSLGVWNGESPSPLNLDVCSIFITCLFRTRQIWGSTCSSSMRFISNWVKKSMAWVTWDLKLSGWTVLWSSSSSLLFGRLVTLVNPEDDHLGTAWVDSSGGKRNGWMNGQEVNNLQVVATHTFF